MFRVSCCSNDGGKTICPIPKEELLEAMRAIHVFYAERQRRYRAQHAASSGGAPPLPPSGAPAFRGILHKGVFTSVHSKVQNLQAAEELADGSLHSSIGFSGVPTDATLDFAEALFAKAGLVLQEEIDHLTIDLAANQYGELLIKISDDRAKDEGIIEKLAKTPRYFDQASGRVVEPVLWDKFAEIKTFFVSRLTGRELPSRAFLPPTILSYFHVWQPDELAFFEATRVLFDTNRAADLEADFG